MNKVVLLIYHKDGSITTPLNDKAQVIQMDQDTAEVHAKSLGDTRARIIYLHPDDN